MNAPADMAEKIGHDVVFTLPQGGLPHHVAIFLKGGRILSDETFRLVKFTGTEQISAPFEFQLELHAHAWEPETQKIDFKDILNRSITIGVNLPGAGSNDFARAIRGKSEENLALWNGIVTDLAMGLPGVFHLTMRPALWKLSLTNRYHIHQRLSIKNAIVSILNDHGITISDSNSNSNSNLNTLSVSGISGTDNPAVARTQDWLQSGESDLDFINRLIQKAHIYFYFEHHATCHKVVFANRATYPEVLEDGRKLRYSATFIDPLGMDQDDLVLDYRYSESMTSTGISNVLARQHAAWEEDTVAQYDTYRSQTDGQLGDLPFQRFKICQYGGSDSEVSWDTRTCDTTRSTSSIALQASSTCPKMRPGYQFALAEAGSPEVNPYPIRPTLTESKYVLSQVQHTADLGASYKNQFKATIASGQIAAFSLQDTQQGMVLATVVKHDNGTPPKDWRYYKKTAFDPESSPLSDSSAEENPLRAKGVYVRFATAPANSEPVWVKLAQHMLTVPELNVVVMVSRANDYSELPEIQSIVQSNGRMDVTPSGWTASTSVGNSYSTSYGDSRSVRFGLNSPGDLPTAKTWVDDKYNKGNSDQPGWLTDAYFRDVSWSRGGSSNYSTAEKGRTDVLSESISVGCNYRKDDALESKSISNIDNSWNESSGISSYNKSTISGTAERHDSVGSSFSTSATGASTQSIATGASNTNSATGVSNTNSATGASLNLSFAVSQNDISAVIEQTQISGVGVASHISQYGTGARISNESAVLKSNLEGVNTVLVSIIKVFL